jgi:hypothetical protein
MLLHATCRISQSSYFSGMGTDSLASELVAMAANRVLSLPTVIEHVSACDNNLLCCKTLSTQMPKARCLDLVTRR